MTVVLQLSDTHLCADPDAPVNDRDPSSRLAEVLAAVSSTFEELDLVLLTGDLADDGSVDGCRRLYSMVEPLDAPILALPGNHDRPSAVASIFGAVTDVEVGAWRVVGFDTSRPGQVHGTLDVPAALSTLSSLDSRGTRPTVVALHHPPASRSTHPWFQLDGAAALLDGLAARPEVKMIVSGHLHDAFELEGPSGLALLGCPSTLMAISHHGDAMELGAAAPTGARVLRLEDDGSWSSTVLVA